jgi:hypothetical protein
MPHSTSFAKNIVKKKYHPGMHPFSDEDMQHGPTKLLHDCHFYGFRNDKENYGVKSSNLQTYKGDELWETHTRYFSIGRSWIDATDEYIVIGDGHRHMVSRKYFFDSDDNEFELEGLFLTIEYEDDCCKVKGKKEKGDKEEQNV